MQEFRMLCVETGQRYGLFLEHDIIASETAIERMEALKNMNTRLPKDEIDKRTQKAAQKFGYVLGIEITCSISFV